MTRQYRRSAAARHGRTVRGIAAVAAGAAVDDPPARRAAQAVHIFTVEAALSVKSVAVHVSVLHLVRTVVAFFTRVQNTVAALHPLAAGRALPVLAVERAVVTGFFLPAAVVHLNASVAAVGLFTAAIARSVCRIGSVENHIGPVGVRVLREIGARPGRAAVVALFVSFEDAVAAKIGNAVAVAGVAGLAVIRAVVAPFIKEPVENTVAAALLRAVRATNCSGNLVEIARRVDGFFAESEHKDVVVHARVVIVYAVVAFLAERRIHDAVAAVGGG